MLCVLFDLSFNFASLICWCEISSYILNHLSTATFSVAFQFDLIVLSHKDLFVGLFVLVCGNSLNSEFTFFI